MIAGSDPNPWHRGVHVVRRIESGTKEQTPARSHDCTRRRPGTDENAPTTRGPNRGESRAAVRHATGRRQRGRQVTRCPRGARPAAPVRPTRANVQKSIPIHSRGLAPAPLVVVTSRAARVMAPAVPPAGPYRECRSTEILGAVESRPLSM